MGKYYDRLVQINESLDRELRCYGLMKENVDPDNLIVRRLENAGLSVGYNSKGIEVSFTDKDEETSKSEFERICDEEGILDDLQNVGTDWLVSGDYVTYGTLAEDLIQEEDEDMVPVPADSLTDDQKKGILADTVKNAGLKVDKNVLDDISKNPEQLAGVQKILGDGDGLKNESLSTDTSLMDWDGPAIIKWFDPLKEIENSFYVNDDEWSGDIQEAYEFPSKEDAKSKIDELVADRDIDERDLYIWSASMKKKELDETIDESEDDAIILRMDDDDLDIHGFVKWDIAEKVDFVDDEKDADVFDTKADAKNMILDICDKFNYDPETFSIQYKNSQVNENDNWISLDPTNGQATTLS